MEANDESVSLLFSLFFHHEANDCLSVSPRRPPTILLAEEEWNTVMDCESIFNRALKCAQTTTTFAYHHFRPQ